MKKRVKFGKIEGPRYIGISKKYNVTWYPGVVGFEGKTVVKYDMKGRSAEDLMGFASNMRRYEEPDDVVVLTSANFDEKVVE